jgi:hypothetical protein
MLLATLAMAAALQGAPQPKTAQPLDFQFYRTRVEPIFLKKRPGHVACYKCHSANNVRFLQRMPAGRTAFTEEESRRNFETVSLLVTPGEPLKSRILIHPLAEEAGGDSFHSGGKHWMSQDDPDWKTLAEWVRAVSRK